MKIPEIEQDAIYKATVCKRCGEVLLRKRIETEYLDGGFTTYEKFEDNPDGWKYHAETGDLCPECEALYQSRLQAFMEYAEECESEN